MGDRVLPKSLKTKEGEKSAIGRFISVEFDASPKVKAIAEEQAWISNETMRIYTLRLKDEKYVERTLERVANEFSPFKDDTTRDGQFVRDMWKYYSMKQSVDAATTAKQQKKEHERVHRILKEMDVSAESKLEEGMQQDEAKMKEFMVKRLQSRKLY